jgi:hypothetical protein
MLLNYMNGTVMYRRCILEDIHLKNPGFFYQTELLIKCLKNGYMYAEVPYTLKKRHAGGSKATTMKSLLGVIKGYISMMTSVYLNKGKKQIAAHSITAAQPKEIYLGALEKPKSPSIRKQ